MSTVTAASKESGAGVQRLRLGLEAEPVAVVRALRRRSRLTALLGDGWSFGDCLIGFEPTHWLEADDDAFGAMDALPVDDVTGVFTGGWLGYFGYPLLHGLERVQAQEGFPSAPSHVLAWYDRALRHTDGVWWLEGRGTPEALDEAARAIVSAVVATQDPGLFATTAFIPERSSEEHRAAVGRAVERLSAGDAFQVNVTTRFRAGFEGDPVELFATAYERLRPRHGALVTWPGGAVASLSPERFLRRVDNSVVTSPIKGTAPRRTDPTRDRATKKGLLASAKDRAENVMIVDLMRNDLARVCRPGTVRASVVRAEAHAVWHLVADVSGELPTGVSDGHLLRATFPPGSVTGAPKVRALELITELECSPRAAYTGAIGAVTQGLGLDLNVAIRTFEVDLAAGMVYVGVGGGIVVNSDPDQEWAECLVKLRPLLDAIGSTTGQVDPSKPASDVGVTVSMPRWSHDAVARLAVTDAGVGIQRLGARTGEPGERTVERAVAELERRGARLVEHDTSTADLLHREGLGERLEVDRLGRWRCLEQARLAGVPRSAGSLLPWLEGADWIASSPPRRRQSTQPRVLVIDNYDSFVHNLVDYLRQLGAACVVVRNDDSRLCDVRALAARLAISHLLISPGPGAPEEAGASIAAVRALGPLMPTLGVCLGHQAIVTAYGGAVVRSPRVVHGQPSLVVHDGRRIWAGLGGPTTLGRYHSLTADPGRLPRDLAVTARTPSGLIMGVQHREHPVVGIQAHPESIMSAHGLHLLDNFLAFSRLGSMS